MKNILIVAFFALIITGCKKKKEDQPIPVNQNTKYDSINGEFKIIRDNIFFGDTLKYMQNIVSAAFFQQKISSAYYYLPENSISVGNVSLNNVQFREETLVPRYVDTTQTFFNVPYSWSVQGNTNLTGFQFVDVPDFPTYSTQVHLPDTIHVNQLNTFNLGNYYSNSVELFVRGSTAQTRKFTNWPSHVITLTAADFPDSNLFYGVGRIYLIFNKEKYRTINGKVYKFITSDFISKTCVYLP